RQSSYSTFHCARTPRMNRVACSRGRGVSALPRTIGLSLLAVGLSDLSLPSDPHVMSRALLVIAVIVLVRAALELRHARKVTPCVVILGGGALASDLIRELESAGGVSDFIAGVVDDQPPPEGTWE